MLADELDYLVGVDTHRDRHTLAVLATKAAVRISSVCLTREIGAPGVPGRSSSLPGRGGSGTRAGRMTGFD
jgi:hypothetical protein